MTFENFISFFTEKALYQPYKNKLLVKFEKNTCLFWKKTKELTKTFCGKSVIP